MSAFEEPGPRPVSFAQLVVRIERVAEARRFGEEADVRRELKLLSQEAGLLAALTPLNIGGVEVPVPRRRGPSTPEHRAKIAEAMRESWAQRRAAEAA